MRGSRKLCQRGSNFDNVFFFFFFFFNIVYKGRMAFSWRADVGPTLNSGLVALGFYRGSGPVLLRNPNFSPVPPLDPRMLTSS